MGGLYHCIVACTHLGNSTATLVAPLFHCGPAKYEAGLHNKKIKRFLSIFVCVKGCTQETVWIDT